MGAIHVFWLPNLYHLHVMPKYPLLNTYRNWLVSCSVSTQNTAPANERRSPNYQPTSWTNNFLQSLNTVHSVVMCEGKAKKLEEEVRCAINNEEVELLNKLEMIDVIQRLGLGHCFEKDIKNNVLHKIVSSQQHDFKADHQHSLHAIALIFRLLRQHGYEISQEVFEDFVDDQGNLMTYLHKDVKGMLSPYEASYLAYEEEDLLDKAMTQTITHLNNLQQDIGTSIAQGVSHALELPLHHRMVMLESRWHIESYSKREDANRTLLELAELNFSMIQAVLQRDLRDMSRWWNDLGLANKLSFSRDRLMECFFSTVGMNFEPEFSSCRKGLTKVTSFITIIDDIYDVYGTLDELELFTDAVERFMPILREWDINAVKGLPDYMKLCFLALYNTVNEMGYGNLKDQGENVIPQMTKAWADLCKAFLQEAKWSYNKVTPSFEDYLENGWRSSSGTVILVHAYFLLGQDISERTLDCLLNYHEVLRWPSIIFRLSNDLGTLSAELLRGETTNSIPCYMNETGGSEAQSREYINKLIEKVWKNMNKLQIENTTPFAKPFVETAINLARIAQCTYQHGDGHGAPDNRSKNKVLSLLIEPIR